MKITLKRLIEAKKPLDKILRFSMDQKLTYRANKVARKVLIEIEAIEEGRMGLIKKYNGKKEEILIPGQPPDSYYKFACDQEEAFEKDWKDFIKEEIEFDIQPIPFVYIKRIALSPYDIAYLEGFIVEPTEAELAEIEAAEKEKVKEDLKNKDKK